MQTSKQALLAAYRHEVPEFVPCGNTGNVVVRCPTDRYFGPGNSGKDMWGVKWVLTQPENRWAGMSPDPIEPPLLEDISDWRDIVFPNLDSIDWESHVAQSLKGVDRETQVVTGLISSGLFERMNQLMGMENALCAFYEDPDEVKEFFAAMADFKIDCIDHIVKYCDVDIIQMHDDWGMSTNMFFSPEIWREFIKPHEARFARHIHSYGLLYEHHSCGYITPIVGDLAEIGVDALNPLNVCNDLAGIKQKYGKHLTLVGGFDNQKMEGALHTPEVLKEEVHKTIDLLAPGGSFVAYFVPLNQSVCDMAIAEINAYGRDFYRR